jgi:dihydroorotase
LTDQTSIDEVLRVKDSAFVLAFKLYPAGATTNSAQGVSEIKKVYGVLEAMQKHGVVLQIHGEVTDQSVDVFERESRFIDTVLIPLRAEFPELKVVFEHITSQSAADYVTDAAGPIAATITPQHLLENRNALFRGGLRPHYYCLPILKREEDRLALLKAATSGNPKFFLGTDSAPHEILTKQNDCGCAGCFTAPIAMELYATAFDSVGALARLECFSSVFGAQFYQQSLNQGSISLKRQTQTVPESYSFDMDSGRGQVVPFWNGQILNWSVT